MTEITGATLEPAVLDRLRAAMDDDDLVIDIINAFRADTPAQIASLVAADQRGDFPAASKLAHLIKGSALTFGAVRLVQLCTAIEVESGDSGECVRAVAQEFEVLTASLSVYLEGLGGP